MRAWAPGRVNLIGEHTDYGGGLVLPAATQFGISLEVRATGDGIVLSSAGYGAADPIAPDGGGSPSGRIGTWIWDVGPWLDR